MEAARVVLLSLGAAAQAGLLVLVVGAIAFRRYRLRQPPSPKASLPTVSPLLASGTEADEAPEIVCVSPPSTPRFSPFGTSLAARDPARALGTATPLGTRDGSARPVCLALEEVLALSPEPLFARPPPRTSRASEHPFRSQLRNLFKSKKPKDRSIFRSRRAATRNGSPVTLLRVALLGASPRRLDL